MKKWINAMLLAVIVAAGCGEAEEAEPPKRLVAADSKFYGPVSGIEKYVVQAEDDSTFVSNFAYTGVFELSLEKGIFAEATFPAEITYEATAKDGRKLSGRVVFPRIRIDSERHFTVHQTTEPEAYLSGFVEKVDNAFIVDLENFAVAVPFTEPTVKSRWLYLGGQLSPK